MISACVGELRVAVLTLDVVQNKHDRRTTAIRDHKNSILEESAINHSLLDLDWDDDDEAEEIEDIVYEIRENAPVLATMVAQGDYHATHLGVLSFSAGDHLDIVKYGNQWWLAVNGLNVGWVPPDYLRKE